MRRFFVLLAMSVPLLVFASPAAAHLLTVDPSGEGTAVHDHWIGGGASGSIPGQGEGLFQGRFGLLPAAHGTGLVQACESLMNTPAAASILAPGRTGTGCEHGD